jgi:hypothetical protein
LDIKHRIGGISLREGRFMRFQAKNRPAKAGLREKGLGIENHLSISSLWLGRLRLRRIGNPACGADCGPHRGNRRNSLGWRALAAGWHAAGAHFVPPKGRRLHFDTMHLKIGRLPLSVQYCTDRSSLDLSDFSETLGLRRVGAMPRSGAPSVRLFKRYPAEQSAVSGAGMEVPLLN